MTDPQLCGRVRVPVKTAFREYSKGLNYGHERAAMLTTSKTILVLLALPLLGISTETTAGAPSIEGPAYTSDAQLKFPEHYRDWVWLTSDLHSATVPASMEAGEGRWFNNVFASPNAYKAFLNTGTWPDKTMLVVEQRAAEDMGTFGPNRIGTSQGSAFEFVAHVKDRARFSGGWGFFGFQRGKTTATMIPATASCYSCHAARGAVDTTFVQFYPALLPIAESKNTLSHAVEGGVK